MSNKVAKTERSAFKDARQSPQPNQLKLKTSKKTKKYKIEYRWVKHPAKGLIDPTKWTTKGHYQTRAIALRVMGEMNRKYSDSFEWRVSHV